MPDLDIAIDTDIWMGFSRIPAGSFLMGSGGIASAEEPIHRVEITQPFYLGITPVTQRQFGVWTKKTGIEHSNHFDGKPDHPAEDITWDQADAYCRWVSDLLPDCPSVGKLPGDHIADLPTEAQWEYACRGKAGREQLLDYYAGNGEGALAAVGWYRNNAGTSTERVGTVHPEPRLANDYGLHDMHGNVWEWCRNVWDPRCYHRRWDGVQDPEVIAGEDVDKPQRVFRGGAFLYSAWNCRAASRFCGHPGDRVRALGFRVGLFPRASCQPAGQ